MSWMQGGISLLFMNEAVTLLLIVRIYEQWDIHLRPRFRTRSGNQPHLIYIISLNQLAKSGLIIDK
jgi:hypothetical protein